MALRKWKIDIAHSSLMFTIRHLVVMKVHGHFAKWEGTIELDDQDISTAHAEAQIESASIDTRSEIRDAHLRSGDFLDAEKFPLISFKSDKITAQGGPLFQVEGSLMLHGVTRPVTLAVELLGRAQAKHLGERLGFSAKTQINRKDFGVVFNEVLDNGGLAISEEVDITIDLQAGPTTEALR
jgi:polyisoprenoid-binding protein YceI